MRVRLGNLISDFRYWSWCTRHPLLTEAENDLREDNDGLHPQWLDNLLLRLQARLWGL